MNGTHSDRKTGGRVSAMAQRTLLALLTVYKRWISPLLPPACRFHPTCSDYAAESIRTHGVVRGSGLALRRVCRCHPLSAGGFDPVPPRRAPEARHAPHSPFTMKEVQ